MQHNSIWQFRIKLYFRSIIILASSFIITLFSISYLRAHKPAEQLLEIFPSEFTKLLSLIFLSTSVAYLLINIFDPKISHLRSSAVYRVIPVWISVSFGFILAVLIDILTEQQISSRYLEWACIGIPSVAVASALAWATTSRPIHPIIPRKKEERKIAARPLAQEKLDKYSEINPKFGEWWGRYGSWISSNDPAEEDLLEVGLEPIALRLLESINNEAVRTIGLVGGYGSGKSSAIGLLQQFVESQENSDRKIFCVFSCWGIEDPDKAVSDLIEACLEEASPFVDVFPVKSLGRKYRDSVSKGDGYLDRISTFIWGESSFERMLAELDQILKISRIRLIIVVEDLDRNSGEKFDAEVILAFLFSLRRFSAISSILAADIYGSQSLKVDYLKLCDHIEDMVSAPSDTVMMIAEEFRDMCLSDQRSKQTSGIVNVSKSVFEERKVQQLGLIDSPSGALAQIIGRPRVFKTTLSLTLDAWVELSGEVCWDHLFVLIAIRSLDGEYYKYILANYEALNCITGDKKYASTDAIVAFLKESWKPIAAKDPYLSEQILTLICYLLPDTPMIFVNERQCGRARRKTTAQGVIIEHYWRRYVTRRLDEFVCSDYTITTDCLHYIATGISSRLVEMLISNNNVNYRYEKAWSNLVLHLIPGKIGTLSNLCIDLHSKACEVKGNAADLYFTFLRITLTASIRSLDGSDQVKSLFIKLIEPASNYSLGMVLQIWQTFEQEREKHYNQRLDMHSFMLETLQNKVTTFELLTRIMPPYGEKKLIIELTAPLYGSSDKYDFTTWRWFFDLLTDGLLAADFRTSEICFQLTYSYTAQKELDMDEVIAKKVFGESYEAAIPILKKFVDKYRRVLYIPD